jgi:hypothetical protein
MADKLIHRTLTMRSALSLTNFGILHGGHGSLEELLRWLHKKYDTVPQRRARSGSMIVEARNVDDGNKRLPVMLHLVGYTPDDQISIVPNAPDKAEAALALLKAPKDAEFLDGNAMILVRDNDVLICRSGLGESALYDYVYELSQRAKLKAANTSFRLMKRVDVDKLELIREEGVAHISMNAIAHETTLEHIKRKSVRKRLAARAWEEVQAILGMEQEVPKDAENVKVEVILSFDKQEGTAIDQKQLTSLAERVLQDGDDEGFSIRTLKGRTLRAEDIVLSKPVAMPAFGKTVKHTDAWNELKAFYAELNAVRG